MNFSETYIRMCEKAAELQEQWQPKAGDYIGEKGAHRIDMIAPERLLMADDLNNIKEFAFWVLRQDQLWETLKTIKSVFLYRYGVNAYEIEFNNKRWTGKDIEPLLLQVYMFENDKVWNGKEWVDANGE